MRLHPFVNHAQLRAQTLDIIANIRLESFNVHAVLVQYMQHLFLKCKSRRLCLHHGLFAVSLETLTNAFHERRRDIGDCVKSRGLEVLEASMVKDLADRSLEGCSVDPRSHERTVLCQDHIAHVLLHEWR
jgi:hypothetical protein